MSRLVADGSAGLSSTTQNIHRFIKDTELDNPDRSSTSATSAPQTSPQNASDPHRNLNTISEEPRPNADTLAPYHKKLVYLKNHDFHPEEHSFAAIPNTFNYKSHPNAKTKELGDVSPPVKTSTVNMFNIENALEEPTPDWMPPELSEKWNSEDWQASVRITKTPKADLNHLVNSGSDSIVHNDSSPAKTPMWKKVQNNYEQNKHPQLKQIFLSTDSLRNKSNKTTDGISNSMSSTLSTPYATMDNRLHFTKDQISEIADLLEQEKDKPDDYPITLQNEGASPLKLFGPQYNTFTKGVLTDIIKKMRAKPTFDLPAQAPIPEKEASPEETVDKEKQQEQPQLYSPKLKTRSFKADPYSEEQFMKKANNIFDNIQKRGFVAPKPSGTMLNRNRSISLANTQSTATSTPKADKINSKMEVAASQEEFSSFSSSFNDESTDFIKQPSNVNNADEYTSISESDIGSDSHPEPSHNLSDLRKQMSTDNPSSYTIDDLSSNASVNNGYQNTSDAYQVQLEQKIKQLESKLNSLVMHQQEVEALASENKVLREKLEQRSRSHLDASQISIDDYELTNDNSRQFQDFIQWKRASQLQLPPKDVETPKKHVIGGRLKPDAHLPVKYDNMILDEENHRWIPSDNKENAHKGSLDSIEDLVSNDGYDRSGANENSILKSSSPRDKKTGTKQEVSFHIPHSNENKNTQLKSSPLNDNNVTRVSQLDELSFTQSQKKLVTLITDALMSNLAQSSDWSKVHEISLVEEDLSNVKDLDSFLPALYKLDLHNNRLRFLEGVPKTILELNLANNEIENVVAFGSLRDLERLNLTENSLTNLNCLSDNIHLSVLNVSRNQLISIKGLQNLSNLTSLDLSHNNLQGKLDFSSFRLPNLHELNLSENKIDKVSGIEALSSLRVLNLNENKLNNISCIVRHQSLKKLLLKGNALYQLNLEPFPFLRVLRFDGNRLHVLTGLKKLKHLDEISCKSLANNELTNTILSESQDLQMLDLSGNIKVFSPGKVLTFNKFYNVNKLVLSAMNLSTVPANFAAIFPGVAELNLNFNKLTNINALSKLSNLKKLFLVSNNINKVEMVVTSLLGSRSTLKVIDMRLNALNIDFYPYVFNPHELEFSSQADTSPILLETLDDIESFAIHFQSLNKAVGDWEERDANFVQKLREKHKIKKRLNYEALLVNFFTHLKKLDGSRITAERRIECETWLKAKDMADV